MAILKLTFLFVSAVHALTPASNTTEIGPPWMPEPRGRGTWSILLSCIFTIITCIWTAIHDDVVHNGTPRKRLGSRIAWMLLALLAPEIVIIRAFEQWKEARTLHKFWCDKSKVERWSKEDQFGMEGAFFVVMGGFTAGPCDSSGYYPATVSVEDFKRLTEEGAISPLTINKKLIMDKGKADTIGKLLALLQAFSIVVQCAARKAEGLPVTLLELHVVVQVFCAGATYAFWWHKPLSVVEPMPLFEHGGLDGVVSIRYYNPINCSGRSFLVGVMQPRTTASGHDGAGIDRASQPPGTDTWFITGNTLAGTPLKILTGPIEKVTIVAKNYSMLEAEKPRIYDGIGCDRQEVEDRRGKDIVLLPGESLVNKDSFFVKYCGTGSGTNVSLSSADIIAMGRGASEIQEEMCTRDSLRLGLEKGLLASAKYYLLAFTQPIIAEVTSRESLGLWSSVGRHLNYTSNAAVVLIFILYGAAHSSAWDNVYPTWAEKLLWRICCVSLMVVPTLVLGFSYITGILEGKRRWYRLHLLFMCLWGFFFCVTPFFSLFLIVESFISIRHLPAGAYKSVVWEDIWPHI